jgi:hypothetical protein
MANLLGHILKKDPAQSVIFHAFLRGEPYHDRKAYSRLITNHVEIVVIAVNQ